MQFSSLSVIATVLIAVIGWLSKYYLERYREEKGLAASLLGEIAMHYECCVQNGTNVILKAFENLLTAAENGGVPSWPSIELPTTYPVFDKVSDKIGMLGADMARKISHLYNGSAFIRNVIRELAKPSPVDSMIPFAIDQLKVLQTEAEEVIAFLETKANQTFLDYFLSKWVAWIAVLALNGGWIVWLVV